MVMKTRSAKVNGELTVAASAATRRSSRLQGKAEPKDEFATATTVHVPMPKNKNVGKRKSPAKAKGSKRRKKGIKGTVDTNSSLGVVDPELILEGDILVVLLPMSRSYSTRSQLMERSDLWRVVRLCTS